jgi:hypothetical protein
MVSAIAASEEDGRRRLTQRRYNVTMTHGKGQPVRRSQQLEKPP